MNQSCNVYFYHYGLRIGGAAITRYAAMFGLGRPTGVVFGGEKSGLIPHPRSARGRKGAVWHAGETVNMSIGQGALLVTPMQVARFMAAVANGGVRDVPDDLSAKLLAGVSAEVIKQLEERMGVKIASINMQLMAAPARRCNCDSDYTGEC